MNSINMIAPYKHHGMWVFDDPRVGLSQEPFVAGADTMIDRVTADIPDAEHGFDNISFASAIVTSIARDGIYCPALLKYFPEAPKQLYVQTKSRVLPGNAN